MFQIMIIKTPRGEADEEVRREWVWTVLPCLGIAHSPVGIFSKKPVDGDQEGYRVSQNEACAILAKKSPAAAEYWMVHGHPEPGGEFVFYKDEVIILQPNETLGPWG